MFMMPNSIADRSVQVPLVNDVVMKGLHSQHNWNDIEAFVHSMPVKWTCNDISREGNTTYGVNKCTRFGVILKSVVESLQKCRLTYII